jgi:hypothetical protein
MKRRLDLAMALVHQPAILFLDEPTTGLDLQSRAGLWDEVARLARDDGATVFLTTQYLEEADVLADRVGIIDHGKIVAEGTPARLKAELGPPTVEIRPAERDTLDAMSRALERFAAPVRSETGALTVPLPEGERQLAELVRALDQAGLRIAALQLHQPTLDDVFLATTSSAPSRTRITSATPSSPSTTASTGTPGSRCTPRRPSTTAAGRTSRPAGPPPSRPPTRRTPSGSAAAAPSPAPCRTRSGSTSRRPPSRRPDHYKPRTKPDVHRV